MVACEQNGERIEVFISTFHNGRGVPCFRIIEKDGLMFGQVSNIVGALQNAASGALIRGSAEVVYGALATHATKWTQYTKCVNCCHKERAGE